MPDACCRRFRYRVSVYADVYSCHFLPLCGFTPAAVTTHPQPDRQTAPAVQASVVRGGKSSLTMFGHEVMQLALSGQHRRALSMALQVREEAIASGHAAAELEALILASRCHSMNNNALPALTSGIDALALAEKLGDPVAAAHAYCSMASSAFALELLKEASPVLDLAVATALEFGDDDLEVRSRITYGENLGDLGEFERAEHQLARAEEAALRLDDRRTLYRVIVRQATQQGKAARSAARHKNTSAYEVARDRALVLAERVLEYARSAGHLPYQASMAGLIGKLHQLNGDIDSAIHETGRALELSIKCQFNSAVSPWSLRLAEMHMAASRESEAIVVLERALPIAESVRPTFRLVEICNLLEKLELAVGNLPRASHWQQRKRHEQALFDASRREALVLLRSQSWVEKLNQ